jgi:predicted dehydrogenase
MEQARFAIVGLGFMGDIYARVLADLPEAALVACCDVMPEKATALAEALNVSGYVGTDYAAMLAQHPDLDGVVVATPDHAHLAPTMAALDAGMDVCVEKPLSLEVDEGQQMVARAKETDRILMVGHTLRFQPQFIAMREAVKRGQVGDLLHLFARRNNPTFVRDRVGERVSVLFFLGIHDIDAILWTLDQPVVKAFAKSVSKNSNDIADTILSILTFADGTLAMLENSWGMPAVQGRARRFQFDVAGTGGVIEVYAHEQGIGVLMPQATDYPSTIWLPEIHGRLGGVYRDQVTHFVDCVRTRRTPVCTGAEALEAVQVAAALMRSLEEGREVTL